ncbi:hypothetical protein DFJ64_2469 [Thermasporomyces composti]|jgi:hypothetical protein|uniref:Uncharacterized protein n=2 Tax=Thermasporomyces composti TaxID=696763 RepID=A0A3D9V8K2_THECX|nr:hypothetical protein DFJ64_2469 [Thermasporomyces composti]
MLAGALVAFAVYEREVSLLITAAVGALAAGVIAVVVFDIELIRARRAHGADRVAQARAYAAMYAAHVRVMAEGFALAEQRRRAAEEQASEQASPDESTTEASTESTSPSVASQLEPVVLAMATAGMAEDAATGRPSEADPADQAATSRPTLVEPSHPRLVEAEATSAAEVGVPDTDPEPVARREDETEHVAIPIRMPVAADDDDAADLWDTFDAPTVVDLMAWEVRARLAAEEERERQARSTGGAEPTNESPASAAGA